MRRPVLPLALVLLAVLAGCSGPAIQPTTTPPPPSLPTSAPTQPPPASSTPAAPATSIPAPTRSVPPITLATIADLEPLSALPGHSAEVTSLAFSPDGAWLASGSRDGQVRLWDLPGRMLAAELQGHSQAVRSLAFSPDGNRLATASEDGTVLIWSVPQGAMLDSIDGLLEQVFRVAFSPDGKLLALAGNRCFIELRDGRLGILRQTLIQPGCIERQGWATSWGLAFSPSGEQLGAGDGRPCCGGSLYLHGLNPEAAVLRLPHPGGVVLDLAFSPDGSLLAVASNVAAIRIWRTQQATLYQTLEGHIYRVNSVSFSPDGGLLASGSRDQTVKIWDLNRGTLLATLADHDAPVTSVCFAPDGSLLAVGWEDGSLMLWGIAG